MRYRSALLFDKKGVHFASLAAPVSFATLSRGPSSAAVASVSLHRSDPLECAGTNDPVPSSCTVVKPPAKCYCNVLPGGQGCSAIETINHWAADGNK